MTIINKAKAAIAGLLCTIMSCGINLDRFDFMSYKEAINTVNTPAEVRQYFREHIDYLGDGTYIGYRESNYIASFKKIHEKGLDDCDGYAVAAAALLSDNGYPPILLSITEDDNVGHALYVFEKPNNELETIDNKYGLRSYRNLEEMLTALAPEKGKTSARFCNPSYHYPDWISTDHNMRDLWDTEPASMPVINCTEHEGADITRVMFGEFFKIAASEQILAVCCGAEDGYHLIKYYTDTMQTEEVFSDSYFIWNASVVKDRVFYTPFSNPGQIISDDGKIIFDALDYGTEYTSILGTNEKTMLFTTHGYQNSREFIYDYDTEIITEITGMLPAITYGNTGLTEDNKVYYESEHDACFFDLDTLSHVDRGLLSHLFYNKEKTVINASRDLLLINTEQCKCVLSGNEWYQISPGQYLFSLQCLGNKIGYLDEFSNLFIIDVENKKRTKIADRVKEFTLVKDGNEAYFARCDNFIYHAKGY